ncbi:unnamed protein product [Bursaphelenchus xylophilus]|uniref:Kinesin-like protein n=1 Tax=Bursaphelenchus xylophilus TaxID=6326 RepID=A0A1I7RPK4_BURXY|nr:unnamed protein product [Bursaphelenchus xylophilus]CAG9096174.1 unnamed protein product [Bursaphelenchus xylophilus]
MEDQTIKVFARVKPGDEAKPIVNVESDQSILIGREKKSYTFDHTFRPQCQQVQIFEKVGKAILNGVLEGFNGTIFAYGQTGSGKTYTMNGPDIQDPIKKGLIPRCLEYLFDNLEQKKRTNSDTFSYEVTCSFVELYNETIYDLLDSTNQPKIRMNLNKVVALEGACTYIVSDVNQVIHLIRKGCHNRHVAETKMNRESSRSHSIFIISVQMKKEEDGVVNLKTAQLNLVDLAGSERQKHSKAEGERLKEAGHINKSLSTLARVIRALSSQQTHIPYRDSILTHLLTDSLGGNSRTAFVLTMHQGEKFIETTISTAQFGNTLKLIENKAHANEDVICESWKLEMARQHQLNKDKINQLQMALDEALEKNRKEKEAFEESFAKLKQEYDEKLSEKAQEYKNLERSYNHNKEKIIALAKGSVKIEKYSSVKRENVALQAKVNELMGEVEKMANKLMETEAELEEEKIRRDDSEELLDSPQIVKKNKYRRMTMFDITDRQDCLERRVKRLTDTSMLLNEDGDALSDKEMEKENDKESNEKTKKPEVIATNYTGFLDKVKMAKDEKLMVIKRINEVIKDELKRLTEKEVADYNERMSQAIKKYDEKMEAFEKSQTNYITTIHRLKEELQSTQRERDDLFLQATENLGHQNNKQKISYVNKLREKNIDLTNENAELKEKIYLMEHVQ